MVEVHYRMVVCHAAVKIISQLYKYMDQCEEARVRNTLPVSTHITLSIPHDDRDDICSVKDPSTIGKNKKAFKKKPLGRIRKWMGDLAMQVCSPLDAVENYVLSISESRSIGDTLWLAGALDGYASAILLLKQLSINLEDAIGRDLRTVTSSAIYEEDGTMLECEKLYLLAEERVGEAMAIYASSSVLKVLEAHAAMKLAMMFARAEAFYSQPQKVIVFAT